MRSITPALLLVATLAADSPADETTVCLSLAAGIPDNAPGTPLVVPLAVPLPVGAMIDDVRIELHITHPWVGDLRAELSHNALSATLVDRVGLGAFPFGCGADDIAATFRDDATALSGDLCVPGADPGVAGDVRPATPLAVFVGVDPSGAWELTLADLGAFDAGTLDIVCLTIVYSTESIACSPADVTTTGGGNGIPDGQVDLSDFSHYLSLWSSTDGRADITPSGQCLAGTPDAIVDLSDFSCYLSIWSSGCP